MQGSVRELQLELEEKLAMKKDIKGKVSWTVFVWVIGVMTAIIGSLSAVAMAAQEKASAAIERASAIEGDIKAMNVKLDYLKQSADWIVIKLNKEL